MTLQLMLITAVLTSPSCTVYTCCPWFKDNLANLSLNINTPAQHVNSCLR